MARKKKNEQPGKGNQPSRRRKDANGPTTPDKEELRRRTLDEFFDGVMERTGVRREQRPPSPDLTPEQAGQEMQRLLGEMEAIYPSQDRDRDRRQALASLQWARGIEKALEHALLEVETGLDEKPCLELITRFFVENVDTLHGHPEPMSDEQAGLAVALALIAVRFAEATKPELFAPDLLNAETFAEQVPNVDDWMLSAGATAFIRFSWDLAIARMADESSPLLLYMIWNALLKAIGDDERNPPTVRPAARRAMQAYHRLVRSLAQQPPGQVPIDPEEAEDPVRDICLLIDQGRNSHQQGHFASAIYDLDKAADLARTIENAPQRNTLFGHAIYGMACCYFDQRQYSIAISNLSIAARFWMNQEELFFLRGQCFMALGWDEEAIGDFQTVVAINPRNAHAYSCLGECQMKGGDLDAARRSLQQALRLDATVAGAHSCLGHVLFKQGEAALSAEHLRMALLLEPSLFPPHWLLAQINMHASRWDEAIVHLNEVIRQAPLVPECFERRAKCYSNLGRTAEAAIDLRTSASLRKRKPG